MTKFILGSALLLSLFICANAQRIDKPTLTPKPCTDSQTLVIQQGVGLHDQKDFDGAIAKFNKVLQENPDCTTALYELSLSYYQKNDKTKAMETAYKGSKYRSNDLPLFYQMIANVIDDVGKPDEAIKIYFDAIKMLESDPSMAPHLSSLHFNLGVTYVRQDKLNEAKASFKRSVETNPVYASPHYMLSMIFFQSRYKIPALLAAMRFISLEYASQRTQRASTLISQIASGSTKKGKDGGVTIDLDLLGPSDEGSFGPAELVLAITDDEIPAKDPKKKDLTPEELFADRIETVTVMLDDKEKKNASTFVGKNYIPFMLELKKLGYVKPLAYLILTSNGNPNALKWIGENEAYVKQFLDWSKNYAAK